MGKQSPPNRKKIMGWALGLSLAANLLFVGAFAGAMYRVTGDRNAPERQTSRVHGYAAPYVQALPRESRKALFQVLRDGNNGARPFSKENRRVQYQQMLAVLRTVPFDPVAAEAVLTIQRDAVLGMQSAAQAAWLAQVTAMVPDDRTSYADKLEKVLERGSKRPERTNKRND